MTIPTGPKVWFITEKKPVVNSREYRVEKHGAVRWWAKEGDARWTRTMTPEKQSPT